MGGLFCPFFGDFRRQFVVVKHSTHEQSERGQVGRVRQQQTEAVVRDLVADATDLTGNDRSCLPHGLENSEPEAFGQAILHDDRGVALQSS